MVAHVQLPEEKGTLLQPCDRVEDTENRGKHVADHNLRNKEPKKKKKKD